MYAEYLLKLLNLIKKSLIQQLDTIGSNGMSQTSRLLCIISLFWFSQYVYLPFTTPFLLAQKVTADFVGLVVGIYGILPLFIRIFVGVFSDKVGYYKPLIITGCAAVGCASIVRVIWPNGIGFLIANIISGLASSLWMCFILFHTKCLNKDQLKKGMGYVLMSCNGGIFVSFMVSAIFYDTLGMVFLCQLSVVSGLIASAIALTLKEKSSDQIIPPKLSQLLQVVKNKRLWFFSLIGMIQQGVLMGSAMSFTNEVAHSLGASAWQIGIMTMVLPASIVFSCFMSSVTWVIRIGPGKIMTAAQISMMLYCIFVVNIDNIYLLIPNQVLMGITGGFVFSWASAEAISQIEAYRRSTAFSIFQSMFAVGMGIVPMIAGVIFHATGSLDGAFYFMAAISLFGAGATAIYYTIRKHMKLKEARIQQEQIARERSNQA